MLDAYDGVRRADEQRQLRQAKRFLDAGAYMIMIESEGITENVEPWRTDVPAKFINALGLESVMFEAAGAILKAHGHDFAIAEEEFVFGADGRASEAAIRLVITPAGMASAAPTDAPRRELAFATRQYNRTVCITNGALPQPGSASGAAGGCTLAQIDAQLVEDHVLKLVAGLVRT